MTIEQLSRKSGRLVELQIDKPKDSFNEYKMELTFGELTAIYMALESDHSGAIADEVYSGIKWFMDKLPGPGEEKEDTKEPGIAKADKIHGEFEPPEKEEPETHNLDMNVSPEQPTSADDVLPEPPTEEPQHEFTSQP